MPERPLAASEVYLALPPTGAGRGVLVLHAWWGLNAFFRSVCDRLAQEGFVAAAPDLFEGQIATTIAEAERLRSAPKREPIYKTLSRAVGQLVAHPAVRGPAVGVVGFSMGAHWAFRFSRLPRYRPLVLRIGSARGLPG